MRIPPKVATISTSIILTLAGLTLFLAPIQVVQAMIYRQGAPFWYPMIIVATVILRSVIAFGLFQRKSWAWLLYTLDKILFLTLYGVRFIQAETLPYAEIERQALVMPIALTSGKLAVALLAYREFTPGFAKHLAQLWRDWRKVPQLDTIMAELKNNNFVRLALCLYFAITLSSQTMRQLSTATLLWAKTESFDSFWVILGGSLVFMLLAFFTSARQKTWGWKIILTLFFFAFMLSLPKQLQFNTGTPENFWIRRSETLLSFFWLGGGAFWLSQPQKGKVVLGKKRK
jgi:hypothetical protein